MKKKVLIIAVIIMMVVPAAMFAGSFLGLKVGPAAILNEPINLEEFDPEYFTTLGLEDLAFGADIRFNVSVLEIAALIQGQLAERYADDVQQDLMVLDASGHVGVGVSLELLGLLDFGVTVGPELGASFWEDGIIIPWFNPEDLESLPLFVRATADVNLGGISVGGFAKIDSGMTIGDVMAGVMPDPATVDLTAVAGISVLLRIL